MTSSNRRYEIKLRSDYSAILSELLPCIEKSYPTLIEARNKRRAIEEIYGNRITVDIFPVSGGAEKL